MMLVSDVTLHQSHTEELLEVLGDMIMSICIYSLTLRVTIDTTRTEEWVEDEDYLTLLTTVVQ